MAIDRTLHKYTLGEELVSAISHGIGAVLAIIGTVFLCIRAAQIDAVALVSAILFGVTMVLLYTVSTVYHALAPNGGKKVLRILDHCFVFVLIIGTYAPYCLSGMHNLYGYILYSVNCVLGVVGITLTAIDMKRFSKFAMVCYILMGWIIVLAFKTLFDSVALAGIIWLLVGGVIYTVGAVLYGLGKKKKYIHSLWHFFVLGGTICHFISIYLYVFV